MNAEIQDLARAAIALPGWRWLPGMKTAAGWRVCEVPLPDMVGLHCPGYHDYTLHPREVVKRCREPDLSDPATLGCLLALVREVWGDPKGSVYYLALVESEPGWFAEFGAHAELYATEAEALVAALEAAP